MKHIAIYGAMSGIAVEVARELASAETHLSLIARPCNQLEQHAKDLEIRGCAKVDIVIANLGLSDDIDRICHSIATPDVALIAWGILPDQQAANTDAEVGDQAININATMPIHLVQILAQQMEERGQGHIVGIGSPAGDRGRKANYIYGAGKAALATVFSGLRQRFSATDIRITLVKPGFVKTAMTEGFDQSGPLWSEPQTVAKCIVAALEKDKGVIYAPGYWRFIMLIIKLLPDFIFKRTNI